jgi:predicted nuclease of predicted toxin-antitoxin system
VKLLFDNNLSVRLVSLLQSEYPDASHVALVGLERGSDSDIWQYARALQYTVVTKDSDFNDLSMQVGPPPKIVWLRIGNCTTAQIAQVLRDAQAALTHFAVDSAAAVLVLVGDTSAGPR